MKYLIKTLCVLAVMTLSSCGQNESNSDGGQTAKPAFAKGADIGWYTEMEKKGYKFYTASGTEMDCPALMKSLGFNSLRFRVWVNPEDVWNGKEDVLKKCLRAKELGMKIMIDFHYSDTWADPGKQYVPKAWESYDLDAMAKAVAEHTSDVLNTLKDNGVDVTWVQVGNEVTNGMLWEKGRVKGDSASGFAKLFKAGADKVKSIYPKASVILHIDNAWDMDTLKWFYSLMANTGVKYDMIGLSLYPSYWNDETNAFEPWEKKVNQAIANIPQLIKTYNRDVMLVEFGMPAAEPQKGKEALETLWNGLKDVRRFVGIFYWEPESEPARNGYALGAFNDGKPTIALSPFSKSAD